MTSHTLADVKLATLLLATFLSGCVQVGPKQFGYSRGIVTTQEQPGTKCPDPSEPPPIPEVAHISIEPGKPVKADAGGEALLRAYVKQIEWAQQHRP